MKQIKVKEAKKAKNSRKKKYKLPSKSGIKRLSSATLPRKKMVSKSRDWAGKRNDEKKHDEKYVEDKKGEEKKDKKE